MKLEFSQQILKKNSKIYNFMKIRPVGTEMLHAGGQTDMMELTVAFSQFCIHS